MSSSPKLRTAPFELWVMQRPWLQNKSLFLLKETIGSLENPSDESQMVSWPLTPPSTSHAGDAQYCTFNICFEIFFRLSKKHVLRSRCLKVNQGERKVSYSRGRARHVVVLEEKVTLWETDAAEWGGATSGAFSVPLFALFALSEYKRGTARYGCLCWNGNAN